MRARHPLPRTWLMTDERMGEALWRALERLPRGSGIVFRHYSLQPVERRALLARIRRVAGRRGLLVSVAAPAGREANVHGPSPRRIGGVRTMPAHSRAEAIAAVRAGADLVFVSPVFPTRSHPDAPALGRARLGLMIRGLPVPVVALGGMDARRFAGLKPLGVHGWAAIDAWMA